MIEYDILNGSRRNRSNISQKKKMNKYNEKDLKRENYMSNKIYIQVPDLNLWGDNV